MEAILHAFIDECGTDSLNLGAQNVSDFFICVATLAEEQNITSVENQVIELKKNLGMRPEHELKSKLVKQDRRIKILEKIQSMPVKFYVFIIDKRLIKEGSGLSYKDSFYKYINRILYQKISKHSEYDKMVIHADEIGFSKFRESFTKYIQPYMSPSLFDKPWEHSFENSKNAQLIQISDIVAGTVMHYLDSRYDRVESEVCYNIIKNNIIHLEYFPYRLISSLSMDIDDEVILTHQQNICKKYIEEFSHSNNEEIKIRVELLKLFMIYSYHNGTIVTNKIIKYLDDIGYPMTPRKLMTEAIGKLREYGVIIAGTHHGYQLATCQKHIKDYITQDEGIIFPMLRKLAAAQKGLKLSSGDGIRLLDPDSKLAKILEIYIKD